MSLSIGNNMEINLCLVSIIFFIVRTTFVWHCSQLDGYNNNWLFSLTMHIFTNGDLQTATVIFIRNASLHKTVGMLSIGCLLCLAFLYAHVNSVANILEVECSAAFQNVSCFVFEQSTYIYIYMFYNVVNLYL